MLTNDSLRSADGGTEAITRRRLLHMAATVAATAPLAALTAGGAQASPVAPATAPRRIRRAVLVPRFGGDATADCWFTLDDLTSYPALLPWVNMDLNFASIASAAGPITVHLSDNDPFTADWRTTAADWLGSLRAAVHIAHGAGHYMTTSPGPVLDTIRIASLRTMAR